MLTGRHVEQTPLSHVYGANPHSLFSLLGGHYRFRVREILTDMCPSSLCSARRPLSSLELFQAYFVGALRMHYKAAFPNVVRNYLPWIQEWLPNRTLELVTDRSSVVERDVKTLSSLAPNDLFFSHISLPHHPFEFVPSGQAYSVEDHPFKAGDLGIEGLMPGKSYVWASEMEALQAYQRHLLQMGYTDFVLGELIDALRASGRFENSLIVVTADHGIYFGQQANGRFLNWGGGVRTLQILCRFLSL